MAKNKDSASYGIIGLGRFGTALAKSLATAGKDVMTKRGAAPGGSGAALQ